jgi:hypothetical protein
MVRGLGLISPLRRLEEPQQTAGALVAVTVSAHVLDEAAKETTRDDTRREEGHSLTGHLSDLQMATHVMSLVGR